MRASSYTTSSDMNTKKKKLLSAIICLAIALSGLFLLQRLLMPKYVDDIIEGAFVAEYYEEDKDFDVIFIGDCEVYSNFSPALIWRDYGINSYIRGSAEQYIWQSYYLMEDTLRYETPKVMVVNIQALQFDKAQREAYNRMSLEGMEWSPVKVRAIKASMLPGEKFIEYVFPILRYHSRWSELSEADFKYMFRTEPVTHNGYAMRVDVKPAENVPEGRPLANYAFSDKSLKYLDMMRELCAENGIELLLIKAPSLYPYWYPQYEEQVEAYAEKYGLRYINFLELADETGIDYNTDTFDGGLHLNLSGAEKMSVWMGRYLSEEYDLKDRRNEPELSAVWEKKLEAYEKEKLEQYERYGIKGEL